MGDRRFSKADVKKRLGKDKAYMARIGSTLMEPIRKKESYNPPPPRSTSETTTSTAGKTKESFTYFDPGAQNVMVVGDFTDWDHNPIALKKQKDGSWKATIPLDPGDHEYRFLVDGRWQDDTQCSSRKPNGFGQQNCIRHVS